MKASQRRVYLGGGKEGHKKYDSTKEESKKESKKRLHFPEQKKQRKIVRTTHFTLPGTKKKIRPRGHVHF